LSEQRLRLMRKSILSIARDYALFNIWGYGRRNLTKALATRGWVISRMVGGGHTRMVRIGSEDGMGRIVRMVARMARLMAEDLPVCTSQNCLPSFEDLTPISIITFKNTTYFSALAITRHN